MKRAFISPPRSWFLTILASLFSFFGSGFLAAQGNGFFQTLSMETLNLTSTQIQRVQELDALDYVKETTFAQFGNLEQEEQDGFLGFKIPGDTTNYISKGTLVNYESETNYTWSGNLTNQNGFLILVSRPEGKGAYVQAGNRFFTSIPINDGKNIFIEYQSSEYEVNDCSPYEGTNETLNYCEEDNNTCPANIAVLVIVTQEAQNFFISLGNPFAAVIAAELGVASTNFAFQNSQVTNKQITRTWEFVDWFTLTNDPIHDLDTLASSPGIQQLRADRRADLVVMLTDDRYAGIAGIANFGPCFDCAFSIVEAPSMIMPRWTLAHELAHNFGADHNRSANVPCNNCEAGIDPCAHAWRFIDGIGAERRTILARLFGNQQAAGLERILHYSNPNVQFNGTPTGTDENDMVNGENDNSKKIRNTGCLISNYYPTQELTTMITGLDHVCQGDGYVLNAVVFEPVAGFPGQPPYSYEWRWSLSPATSGFPFSDPSLAGDPTFSVDNFPFLFQFSQFWLIVRVTAADGTVAVANKLIHTFDCPQQMKMPGAQDHSYELAEDDKLPSSIPALGPALFPNPASGRLQIMVPRGCGENAEVIVCDLQGTPLKKFAVDASQPILETDLSELPAGMYLCKIPNENGFYLQKFILVK